MRPINVTLCSTTWELAKQKANFSGWVRRKLSEEVQNSDIKYEYICEKCIKMTLRGPSHVQGILSYISCLECGGVAWRDGVVR